MKTIVGIRPTGKLHIGHYFSVIKPALEDDNVDVLVATYHMSPPSRKATNEVCVELNSLGILPKMQEVDVDLYFKLLSASRVGELERMIQYKSVKVKTPHLLVYPVLMAHDLVGYDRVIVGEDQKQHVEYANTLFKRLGMPTIKGDFRGGRIMSLTDPTKKMSKSEPKGCLFLDDNFEEKLKGAVTTPAGVKNLSYIASQFGMKWLPNDNKACKEHLATVLEKKFGKIGEENCNIYSDNLSTVVSPKKFQEILKFIGVPKSQWEKFT
jgi:tryptophanyl-tRNA synthetase